MDSRLLEYFLRVAELGSINRTAVDLHLSQPALSRHIAALEHDMGTRLFNRSQAGVQLTEAGKLLADRARPLLRQFAILKEQIGEQAAGQLAIGIPPSWQQVFTSAFVATMIERHPSVALRVHEGVSHMLREHMSSGLLDLCVVPFDTSPAVGYQQTALVREPLVLVGRAADKLRAKEPVPISRLDGARLVLPARPNVLRAQVEHSLTRKGMIFRLEVETDTLTLCLDLARRGLGLTVVPACSMLGLVDDDAISWAPIRSLYMTWALRENKARSHSPALREGRQVALDTVAEALRSKAWFGAEGLGSGVGKRG